ncbi:tetratricopeptide repeat protein [Pseudomonadales bacterium]|nr:tetratricopeptide repeat protein [Pseudomonadales bacterium]
MNEYRTDEEQVEVLKKWWKENGSSTLISIAVALAVVFSWRTWQDSQQANIDNASFAYQELLEAIAAVEADPDDIKIATVDFMAQELKDNYSGSGYSLFAALLKARQAVNDDDLVSAEEELNWVLANNPSHEMILVTELRLAKVLHQQSKTDEALAVLARTDTGAFTHAFLELKGDILVNEEDYQGAVDAYAAAEAEVALLAMQPPQTLALKLAYAKSFL